MNKYAEKRILSRLNGIMLWIVVLSTSLLLIPFEVINESLASTINSSRYLLWIAFIVSVSFFISQGIILCFNLVSRILLNKQRIERITKAVTCLDFTERAVLREFILQRKSVLNLPINEPTIRNLISNDILIIAEETLDTKGYVPVMINMEARPLITYKALGLSKGKMTEDQIQQIMNARPSYAKIN
ncbi:MAG: super-infection exclusion protein B [Succinivibrionaceae bacterium]|nr:super-infection exclusion protein B [Succinivibrionaceae bacterium]MEE1339289.1 super-infection exclusion protein B [Succinivibrionaceae bacterium]